MYLSKFPKMSVSFSLKLRFRVLGKAELPFQRGKCFLFSWMQNVDYQSVVRLLLLLNVKDFPGIEYFASATGNILIQNLAEDKVPMLRLLFTDDIAIPINTKAGNKIQIFQAPSPIVTSFGRYNVCI